MQNSNLFYTFAVANQQLLFDLLFRLYYHTKHTMQDYLSHIFAHAPVPIPDAADLEFEVQDLLRHEAYAQKVFNQLQHEPCPYRREGLLECLRRELRKSGMLIDGNLYMKDDNDYCCLVWLEAEREINRAIRACEEDNSKQQDCLSDNLNNDNIDNFRPNQLPRATRGISSVVQQVKDTVKHTIKEIAREIKPTSAVNIHIEQLTIPIHIYNAPIEQCDNTTIAGLDNLIQDNHGTMNF